MLAASVSAPNTRPQKAKSAPTPSNWFGVTNGMESAKTAIANGKLEQAEQILSEMLEFAPAESTAWKLLAHIQRKLGRIEAGIASATRALQLQGANLELQQPASLILSKLLWQQNEREQALEMIDLLIQRSPEDQSLITLKNSWQKESDS